jgi:hypothetical protein
MRQRLEIPPGINTDDTAFKYPGTWRDCDQVRFWKGSPEVIGGWESVTSTTLTGVARAVHTWVDNDTVPNIAVGMHNGLNVIQDSLVYDITPTLALPQVTLTDDPLSVTNGSSTVVVSQIGHPYIVGDSIIIAGATAVGGITPNGTFTITVVTDDTWSYTFSSNATGTTTGGGSAVTITPQRAWTGGSIDGTGGAGYGTGAYGTGEYSEPATADYYALTWSLDNWGESLMANPRGQTIFWWQNDTGTPAAALKGAPANVTYSMVAYTRQVMAFGCNEESSGNFNPMCIRFSNTRDPEAWTTGSSSLAGEVILEGSGRIVSAKSVGDYIFVWTNNALYQGSFTGDTSLPWSFVKVGDNCGLAGPNAATVVSQTAYWFSSQKRFMYCSVGGTPDIIYLAVGDDMAANIAYAKEDKIVAASLSKFNEVWWFYPDQRDGIENSRYVSLSISDGAASRGTLARTAFCDVSAASNLYPIGITYDGNVYYHEKGISADGSPRSWFIETSDFYVDEQERCMMLKRMWPDFQRQIGAVFMTLKGLQYPQSTPVVFSAQTLTPNTTKMDFRFSGRLIRMRLEGTSLPTDMRLGVPAFDVALAGDR